MKLKSSLLLALSVTPILTQAALGPIVITPTRTEQTENLSSSTVYTITQQDIESSGAKTSVDLLRGIAGIQIDDLFGNGTEVSLSVRGFSGTSNANTLVLINGHRINHSDTATPDIHHISPKDIERIEILAGSAGTLYGDQAVGGVINIITKKSFADSMNITTKLGSFGYKGVEFNSSKNFSNSLSARVSIEQFDADHYRDNNEQKNSNLSTYMQYQDDSQRAFIDLQFIDDELKLPGALLEAEYNADPTQSVAGFEKDYIAEKTTSSQIGYIKTLGQHRFSIETSQRKTEADIRQSFRNSPSPADGYSTRKNSSINPKMSGTFKSSFTVPYVVGIDLEKTDYDISLPNSFGVSTASDQQQNDSLFFQLNPQISDALRLTFGMRKAQVNNKMKNGTAFPTGIETDDSITVKELGLAYQANEHLKFSFRIDENFRFAKVNELALADSTELLNTQTGDSIELGVDWEFGTHHIVASMYQLNLKNEIVFDPTVGPDFGFGPSGLNINLDKTQRNGLTLSVHKQITPKITLKTDVGLVNARYKSDTFNGKDISGVAQKIAKLRINYHPSNLISSYAELHYSGGKYAQGDNANAFGKIDAHSIINIGSHYQINDWSLHFRINNLNDKKYAEFITNNGYGAAYQPSPERNFFLSAKYDF